MDILGLYDEDMSLFSGDLLGLAPAPVEDRFGDDGLKSSTVEVKTAHLGNDVLGVEQSDKGLLDPFDHSWLDTRVDLLDYLADNVSGGIEEVPAAPSHTTQDIKSDEDSATAVKVLQSVAEDTIAMIQSSDDRAGQPVETEQPMEHDGGDAGNQLLEMLASGLTDIEEFIPLVDDSSILSPVTPEDVESLLSSGPPSPSAADLSVVSASDSSLVDSSFSTSDSELVTVDLAQLLSQVQDQQEQLMLDSSLEELEDPTYEPYVAKKTSARPKPYERKSKKDTAPAKLSKEAKQLERKLRKKQQNKDAATRYREKKRQEANQIYVEADRLEDRNKELKDKVGQMTREIAYLKNLLAEVYEAKGLMKKSK